jgi:hypothetical protein
VLAPQGVPVLAVVFETQEAPLPERSDREVETQLWDTVLERLSLSLGAPLSTSMRSSGMIRSVSDTSVVIVKTNEARLWTASAAREDAEATLLQAMSLRAV